MSNKTTIWHEITAMHKPTEHNDKASVSKYFREAINMVLMKIIENTEHGTVNVTSDSFPFSRADECVYNTLVTIVNENPADETRQPKLFHLYLYGNCVELENASLNLNFPDIIIDLINIYFPTYAGLVLPIWW